ncbi:hypothetical protein Y032_0067g14 [Ancylostoma ceylanicum]|uniref:Uncharacterized protein n=1 Tax=Ancylostoma ceylanicum TaxID=53326 RepID=A0A016TZ98_9BILA|nr:hypothetical protein Y032_0067g14 [Ancylostoma ceylanicum]
MPLPFGPLRYHTIDPREIKKYTKAWTRVPLALGPACPFYSAQSEKNREINTWRKTVVIFVLSVLGNPSGHVLTDPWAKIAKNQ